MRVCLGLSGARNLHNVRVDFWFTSFADSRNSHDVVVVVFTDGWLLPFLFPPNEGVCVCVCVLCQQQQKKLMLQPGERKQDEGWRAVWRERRKENKQMQADLSSHTPIIGVLYLVVTSFTSLPSVVVVVVVAGFFVCLLVCFTVCCPSWSP